MQSRSSNILQHLAAELRRAESGGGGSGGQLPSRGSGGYPAGRGASSGVRRGQSDPDFLAAMQPGQSQR
jgi:hypothetical protein